MKVKGFILCNRFVWVLYVAFATKKIDEPGINTTDLPGFSPSVYISEVDMRFLSDQPTLRSRNPRKLNDEIIGSIIGKIRTIVKNGGNHRSREKMKNGIICNEKVTNKRGKLC